MDHRFVCLRVVLVLVFEWQLESGIEFDYVHVEFCAGTRQCVKPTVPVVMLPYLV